MKVTFWGTRGSIAKAGPSTVRYGGNTSCVEMRTDSGALIVIDCGTGAHGLGHDLLARSDGEAIDGHLLISHTHWDHIQGLPFFAPLFQPGSTWHVYGPRGLGVSVSETLAGQMEHNYFPISLEQLAAQVHYHDLVEGTFEIEDVVITTQYLNHPALTLGYRLEADNSTVVYAADHEPHRPRLAYGGDITSSRHDRAHLDFLRGADLLIHDAQYLSTEYEARTGWGHSTVEYVVDLAHQGDVARVALYHHDPSRTDDDMDVLVEMARARGEASGHTGEIFAAAEGLTIDVVGSSGKRLSESDSVGAATRKPAEQKAAQSVLIAVQNHEIADVVRAAAVAEGLRIWEAATSSEVLEIARNHEPSIIVLEDSPDVLDQGQEIRASGTPYGDDVSIVTVTSAGIRKGGDHQSVTDWILWPSSGAYVRTRLHALMLRQVCRWQNAPLPADEDRRLAMLRSLEVLDTEPEGRFDRLTQEASSALDVPVALVSLVDVDRQWFKSTHGLSATETHRDAAFCAHAILDDEILQVPDALKDPRFADNPLVKGDPRVRFYAGVPLRLSDGSQVGTLCVLDYRPRLLSAKQLDVLGKLGQLVSSELELPSDRGRSDGDDAG